MQDILFWIWKNLPLVFNFWAAAVAITVLKAEALCIQLFESTAAEEELKLFNCPALDWGEGGGDKWFILKSDNNNKNTRVD